MNSFQNVFRPLSWLVTVLLAAVVAGCGGGGDDAPPPAAPAVSAKPIGDIAGVWTITETDIQSADATCMPPGNALATYPVTITQASGSTTISVAGDRTNGTTPTDFAGTLKGNKAAWTGKFAEQGGITTINSLDSTVDTTCNSMTAGTSTWTFVQDAPSTFTCSGTTTFTGTRNTASGCAPAQSAS